MCYLQRNYMVHGWVLYPISAHVSHHTWWQNAGDWSSFSVRPGAPVPPSCLCALIFTLLCQHAAHLYFRPAMSCRFSYGNIQLNRLLRTMSILCSGYLNNPIIFFKQCPSSIVYLLLFLNIWTLIVHLLCAETLKHSIYITAYLMFK